ncbi:uncharacterized protein BX664DRAFT_383721 [Halteromyces radiatus]|uniref:uncharacterized protein n=1 Tax=Halteromyces radiatus TaxID=101107 RepID=UPI0022202007|nr:uncharacterized protein BX664DRAFT_383721 [Halteromyces radiatus]KAI8097433.1 hypothetical protein BX664DRAFT_383721 [Halteromyces radiatus]
MKFNLSIISCLLLVTGSIASESCSIIAKEDLDGRTSPGVYAKRVTNIYKKGDCIKVKCQTTGDVIYGSKIWDYDGTYYLPDVYVKTGYDGFDPQLKRCSSTPPPPHPPPNVGCGGHLNEKSLSLLKQLEGWNPNFYDDGLDNDATHCKNIQSPITEAEGAALLKQDVASFESYICNTVTKQLKCPLNCNQFGALVIFAYNVGISDNGFRASKIYEQLADNCNYKGVADVWTSSFTTNGILIPRRKQEVAIWNTPSLSRSGC